MKVCLITWAFTNTVGWGEGIDAYELACGLARLGHLIEVYAQRIHVEGHLPKRLLVKKLPWGGQKYSGKAMGYLSINLLLKRISPLKKFDVIHQLQLETSTVPFVTNTPLILSGYLSIHKALEVMDDQVVNVLMRKGLFLLKESVARKVVREASVIDDLLNRAWWHYKKKFLSESLFLKKAKMIIARHTLLKDWLINIAGLNYKMIKVVPGCVNTEMFKPWFNRERQNKPLTVLYVGGLRITKGLDILIRSMSFIVRELDDVKLLIAGEGPMKSYLLKLVNDLKLRANVSFLGHVPRHTLPSLYNKADVFCLPSFYESFGFVVLEAMSCGLPVVASNVGGIRDIVRNGVDGFLVTPGDIDELSEALIRLLLNAELRRRMGSSARGRVVSDFSPEVVARKTVEVYEEARGEYGH